MSFGSASMSCSTDGNRLRVVASRQEHIGGFQVAMDDAFLVSMVDGAGENLKQACGMLGRLWLMRQLATEGAAVHVLLAEKGPPSIRADVVDTHDVGMFELRDGLGFRAKRATCVSSACSAARIILSATYRRRPICQALYTIPMPPRPSTS